jgi:hypothetical protein
MNSLSIVALSMAIVHIVIGLFLCVKKENAKTILLAYPRHPYLGKILSAVCIAWLCNLAYKTQMPFPILEQNKIWIFIAGPALLYFTVMYLNELLSARALGALVLLACSPILDAARPHLSQASLIVPTVTYIWVIAGVFLVVQPWRFRKCIDRWFTGSKQVLAFGVGFTLVGAVLGLMSLLIYPS